MNLADTPDEAEFREHLRTWLADAVPAHERDAGPKPAPDDWPARRAYDTAWQRRLFDAGYAGIDWPTEGGGQNRPPAEQLIFVEELERASAPYVGVNFVGLLHAGPTIAYEGTASHKERFLPGILSGADVWCQGFSEPDAGSDLAALSTRAEIDGDDYVVSGTKIWTSHAEVADWCELLVRTGPSGHGGITWLIMPMDAPGIEIRPLRTIAGSTEFAELWLEDVRVPVANRVGAENEGWSVAMTTLRFERGTAFVGELLQSVELLRSLRDRPGADLVELGRIGAQLDALWALVRWNVSNDSAIGGSVFKLAFSELRQRLGTAALGDTLVYDDDADVFVNSLSRTIAAGTSQIQRNIVAERILGLPKEARS